MSEEKQTGANKKGWRPISIVFGVLGIVFVVFVIWALFRFGPFNGEVTLPLVSPSGKVSGSPSPGGGGKIKTTPSSTTDSGQISELVGTWKSDCLVPDPDSPWSERHQFVINADGAAVHTRWSNDTMAHDCSPSGSVGTLVNNFTLTIPNAGKINLTDTGGAGTIYDIYQVSGNTLEFGHGFRNGGGEEGGMSEGARIGSLNSYIVYRK